MTNQEDLYENLPDAFKEVFTNKKNQEDKMKKENKITFDVVSVVQEMLEKIKHINKQKQSI